MGKKVSVRGSLLGEIERRKVVRDKKEVIETRFILFKSRFNFKVSNRAINMKVRVSKLFVK